MYNAFTAKPVKRKSSREVGGKAKQAGPLNPPPFQGVLPQNGWGTELNHTVTCMVLRATANDKRTSSP
ncbi:hypothetical protein TNCV_1387641 [Trichonephila clavipes]|nr:hypothetical protein TNCV_1387641 [Trichonephila clavipes]